MKPSNQEMARETKPHKPLKAKRNSSTSLTFETRIEGSWKFSTRDMFIRPRLMGQKSGNI
jgi:hypothetical protein